MATPTPSRRPRRTPGTPRPADTGSPRREALAVLARAARGARSLGTWLLAAAGSETGRRLGRAAALTVALAVLVATLYDRGEVPSAAAQPVVGAAAAGGTAAPGGTAGGSAGDRGPRVRRPGPGEHGGLRGRTRPPRVGERPAAVAVAWYAARHGLPTARVKALQQDRLSAREVRVLVLADPGDGRLRTALVRVRRVAGGWSVR